LVSEGNGSVQPDGNSNDYTGPNISMMSNFSNYIANNLYISLDLQYKILYTLVIIALLWVLRLFVIRLVYRRTSDVKIRYQWRKTTFYLGFLVAILLGGRIWYSGFQSFSTYFGLLSAGIAISLKDLLASIAGWIFLMIKKPFTIGDRIQIGELRGDVIDVRLFKFTLLEIGNWVDADQSTGRVIHVPNSLILTESLANYSKGFEYIWDEIPVLITFESDWEKAKALLLGIAQDQTHHLTESAENKVKSASRKFMIFYSKLTPAVFTSVKESGVLLTIRYLCEPRSRRGQQEKIWEEILRTFRKEPSIDFAYPTTRFFNNTTEGKQQ